MANDFFQFKQFTIRQSRCAMKVGTDGTLLGAWAQGGRRVLDVGTGTGLIALMMAQRFPDAEVLGVDIDEEAACQARDNVLASPFASRISIMLGDVAEVEGQFDAIVCNPPFFVNSLHSPDARRTLARHAQTLTYAQLVDVARRLLTDDGEMSVVIPANCRGLLVSEMVCARYYLTRQVGVKTAERKPVSRYLLSFRKTPSEMASQTQVLELAPGVRSPWYAALTSSFYL